MNTNIRPVTIVTGFPGAGKTTFLNALIEAHKTKRLTIIESEFGETGIDAQMIIFIGKNLKPAGLEKMLSHCLSTSADLPLQEDRNGNGQIL